MSIKTKIRSLIAAANAKTGKGDTDLTTAVQAQKRSALFPARHGQNGLEQGG